MAGERIVLIIGKDGQATVEGEGFSGPACDKALREIAEALGVVEDVCKRPEYYAQAAHATKRPA